MVVWPESVPSLEMEKLDAFGLEIQMENAPFWLLEVEI